MNRKMLNRSLLNLGRFESVQIRVTEAVLSTASKVM